MVIDIKDRVKSAALQGKIVTASEAALLINPNDKVGISGFTPSGYVKALKNVKNAGVRIKGCSHITGGGFFENVPRMLPENVRAVIKKDSYPVPALFDLIQKNGNIEEHMMYNTFNMGLGMVIAVNPKDVDATMKAIEDAGDKCYVVGNIVEGDKGVDLC